MSAVTYDVVRHLRRVRQLIETFRQIESALWERRATEELVRTGVRTGGSLTRTEASVAELVATGQTNRQIAGHCTSASRRSSTR